MAYEYYADGDYRVARIDLDNDTYAGQQRFQHDTFDWAPNVGDDIHAAASVGEFQRVPEAEAMRVCDVIRQHVTATQRPGMTALQTAKAIAHRKHADQTDKAGHPYIGHVSRVAARVSDDPDTETVAWLHDVVEDTGVDLSELSVKFAPHIIAAVDAITRREGEDPADYYTRVRSNDLARRVKLADIADNSDPMRLAVLDSATRERLQRKYRHAREAVSV